MRVLHLNNPAQVASNLVLAQRSLGLESSLVVTSTKGWHSNFDHNLSDIDTRQVQGKLSVGKKLYDLVKECDILHYHGQAVSEGYRDLVMWSGIMSKPVILHHHGSEIRNKKYPKFAGTLVKHRYVSTPDLLEFVPDAEWLPNPVNLDNLKYSETDTTGPLKILHAPTNRDVKNTEAVLDAITQVEMDGLDIQFTLVENVQHSELVDQVSKNDLVIDWLNPEFGIYGVLAIACIDGSGVPMRGDISGNQRRRLLMTDSVGFRPVRDGQRKRKLIRGKNLSGDISQINLKVIEYGPKSIEELLKAEVA